MIPISDNVATRRQPLINYGLIGMNLVVFLWELRLEVKGELGDAIASWGVVPAKMSAVMVDVLGGNPAAGVAAVMLAGSLLSAMFLHGSFGQILGNLLFLGVFGKSVENILGHIKYLGLYLLGGILTAIIQIIAEPSLKTPLVGANGAVAVILGAYILCFSKAKIDSILPLIVVYIPVELPAYFYLFWWFVQQMFYGIGKLDIPGGVSLGGVGYWMHGVGLVIGVVLMRSCQLVKKQQI